MMQGTKRVRAALLIAFVLSSFGCQATPTERWAYARETLTVTQDALRAGFDAGLIDGDVILTADPYIQAGRGALFQAADRLPDEPGVDAYLDAAEAAVLAVVRLNQERSDG